MLLVAYWKEAFAHDFKVYFQRLGFQFLVPPTVVMELTFAAEEENGEKQALARKALDNFTRWRIQPFGMTAVENLLELDETSLSMAFNDADLTPVNPAHPKQLLRSAQRIL